MHIHTYICTRFTNDSCHTCDSCVWWIHLLGAEVAFIEAMDTLMSTFDTGTQMCDMTRSCDEYHGEIPQCLSSRIFGTFAHVVDRVLNYTHTHMYTHTCTHRHQAGGGPRADSVAQDWRLHQVSYFLPILPPSLTPSLPPFSPNPSSLHMSVHWSNINFGITQICYVYTYIHIHKVHMHIYIDIDTPCVCLYKSLCV